MFTFSDSLAAYVLGLISVSTMTCSQTTLEYGTELRRERFQEVKCLFCWHTVTETGDSCQLLREEWLPTGAALTFLMMAVLGTGSCAWRFSLEFAPLALPVNVEVPHTWSISLYVETGNNNFCYLKL